MSKMDSKHSEEKYDEKSVRAASDEQKEESELIRALSAGQISMIAIGQYFVHLCTSAAGHHQAYRWTLSGGAGGGWRGVRASVSEGFALFFSRLLKRRQGSYSR